MHHPVMSVGLVALLVLPACGGGANRLIFEDRLVAADLFSSRAEILSAGYGFEGIIGVDGGGTIRVVGLADLGEPAGKDVVYDDCYVEDWDNYIDIVLDGDEAAMRAITAVEIPAKAPYGAFYNPGGPGNDPTPGVRYTAPGPAQVQPVTIALDDPLQVDYGEPT